MNDGPSEALIEAIADLWRIPTAAMSLFPTREFKRLSKTCQTDYPSAYEPRFALANAVLALGHPCYSVAPTQPLEAARLLDRAFRATRCCQRHLVPLNLARELPALTFGPVTLARFSETDLLERLVPTCLERVVMKFNSRRLVPAARFRASHHTFQPGQPQVHILIGNAGDELADQAEDDEPPLAEIALIARGLRHPQKSLAGEGVSHFAPLRMASTSPLRALGGWAQYCAHALMSCRRRSSASERR